ncbi:uncharacterized protein LOC119370270 [Jatropha curcas]|uniref:uncharacterized protein LOC119370270 n=1 Tax=Jatropha curcas TaxID=180498 RepID=UPI001892E42D|nr:uncharacterized protein LOC119370270 [Jatropha curcas]
MRGFQSEVDLGKARVGGSSTDASAFWDLLDPPMRSRVISAGFADVDTSRFHCELTLTPADFTAITRLGFDGDTIPLDDRYQTAALGAELVATLLGVTTRTKYTSQGYVSYEVMYKFWAERIRVRLAAWRELPVDVRPAAPAYTREERDQAARSFIFYIISSQLLCTSQNKGDPAVLACLRDLSLVSTFDWASLALAHLYHGLDVWTEVVVSLTGSSSAHSRYGHMSIRSILGVLRVILLLRLDGFPDIWFTAIILTPFWRIRTTGGATLMTGCWLISC